MDKVNRALYGVDDNAQAIRVIEKRLNKLELAGGGPKIQVVSGSVVNSYTVFGTVRINGPTVVLAVGRAATYNLVFAGKIVSTGYNAVIAALDAGEGELRFNAGATSSKALLIGDFEVL